MSKEPPLPAVRMTGKDKLYRRGNEQIILWMVGEQDMVAGGGAAVHKPRCLRLVFCSHTSDTVKILSARVSRFGRLGGSKRTVVRNVSAGQSGKNNLPVFHCDGFPSVVQDNCAGCGDTVKIRLIQHPLVVAEGEIGRRDGSARMEKGQYVLLCVQWRLISFRLASVKYITSNGDERGFVTLQRSNDRCEWTVVQV